jgi:hypothetical protein
MRLSAQDAAYALAFSPRLTVEEEEDDGKGNLAVVAWCADPGNHSVVAVLRPLKNNFRTGTEGPAERGAFLHFGRACPADFRYDREQAKKRGASRA